MTTKCKKEKQINRSKNVFIPHLMLTHTKNDVTHKQNNEVAGQWWRSWVDGCQSRMPVLKGKGHMEQTWQKKKKKKKKQGWVRGLGGGHWCC